MLLDSIKTPSKIIVKCPDQSGIISKLSGFLHEINANIIDLDQHTTAQTGGLFYQRLEFETSEVRLSKNEFESRFNDEIAKPYEMQWRISYGDEVKKVAIFVSKSEHTLLELLWRWKTAYLPMEISCIISNHEVLREQVESFGLSFIHVNVTKENKAEAEAEVLSIVKDCDLIILARYMQILSEDFVSNFPDKIINIHHSFLPAFIGANPYKRAFERGVKLIGATAHYVTADLDAGPIIEQDVRRVGHRNQVKELKEIGKEIERAALSKAVKWHLEDRVLVHENRTIIFA